MDVGSVECVSCPDAAPTDVDAAALGFGTLLAATASRAYPKGSSSGGVHELLECPVCTNSMFPPIHQVWAPSLRLSSLSISYLPIHPFNFQMGI
jgi:hypothetical protein